VKINYHVALPGLDPFNLENPADPGARALYYGISATPNVRMDGKNYESIQSPLFNNWGKVAFDDRSLELASASIEIEPITPSAGAIVIKGTFTPIVNLPGTTALHIVGIEKDVPLSSNADLKIASGETDFQYVMKKMLPNAAGTKYSTLQKDVKMPFEVTWEPGKLYNPSNDLAVVVFLQDENSRTVHQSVIKFVNSDPSVVTGIEPSISNQVKIYPNPANQEFKIVLPENVMEATPVRVVDSFGREVHTSFFEKGENTKTIATSELAGGVYLIQVNTKQGIVHRKVMVVHE
jgi:hypothetical protein